ncbi:MAG: gamma-glutamyltransferase [Pseudomonadota bacterium]
MTLRVAVAAPSAIAAEAAAFAAKRGGNAVDVALAAAQVAINTEPGVCSLAGGGFVTVWAPGQGPFTFDGNVAVPGCGGGLDARDGTVESVSMRYGGGITTLVGAGSVATPGTLAALHAAWQRFGAGEWRHTIEPAIDAARNGFPLSTACHHYLTYSGAPIFSRSPDSRAALYDTDGLLGPGATVHVPHLAETLTAIARDGPAVFYEGPIGERVIAYVAKHGGSLNQADLTDYDAVCRPSLVVPVGAWQVATNPPPAVGGAMLAAVLKSAIDEQARGASLQGALLNVLPRILSFRRDTLDASHDLDADSAALLRSVGLAASGTSSATIHVSAVDSNGLGCAVTASSGYGSGDMPEGTGLWLNNCLGEIDLNRHGLAAGPAGSRLMSNMAPSCARRGSDIISIGSPGASRITTALAQTLLPALCDGVPIPAAIDAPRLHIEYSGAGFDLAAESGIAGLDGKDVRWYDDLSMYFGGVGAAWCIDEITGAAADPRRTGAIYAPAAGI